MPSKWFDLAPELTAEAAAREAIGESLKQTRRYLRRLGKEVPSDNEIVHQLRVTTRRGGAAFRLFKTACSKKESQRWSKRLKKVRRAAGRARDLDVLIQRHRHAKKPDKRLIRELKRERQAAQIPLLHLSKRWKGGESWRMEQKKFQRQLKRASKLSIGGPSWGFVARAALMHCLGEFERLGQRSTRSVQDLHRFRIQSKRLRYTLEWMLPLVSEKKINAALKDLKRIQDHLGTINDHVVAVELLKSAAPAGKRSAKLINAEEKQLEAVLKQWASWWNEERQRQFGKEVRDLF